MLVQGGIVSLTKTITRSFGLNENVLAFSIALVLLTLRWLKVL